MDASALFFARVPPTTITTCPHHEICSLLSLQTVVLFVESHTVPNGIHSDEYIKPCTFRKYIQAILRLLIG